MPPLDRVDQRRAGQLRHRAGGSGLAILVGLGPDAAVGADDSDGGGSECAVALDSRAPSDGVGRVRRSSRAHSRSSINRWHKGDDEALKGIEKNLKRPVFACLPNDFRKASTAVNLGAPLMENHNNVLGNSYRQLAMQLAGPALRAPAPTSAAG